MFADFGNIKSLVLMQNEIGQFGFICFDDPEGKNKDYGPACAQRAIQSLNHMHVGDSKLYLRPALKKAERELEKKKDLLKYKNSKKRCNLYVKGFPNHWKHDQVKQVFERFGDIENIRVDQSQNGNSFAFVCF